MRPLYWIFRVLLIVLGFPVMAFLYVANWYDRRNL